MTTRPLAVESLRKVFVIAGGAVRAVEDVSFEVNEGEFYTLLGPSGCGKTTTLRCVAGLEDPDGGRIVIDNVVVAADHPRVALPPHRRGIGMVFQSYAIWPHMSVFENVAFPLRMLRNGITRSEIARRVGEALETVQLGGYEKREATALSGGQQQRLALARALVARPKLLLLDEPLSNLDAKLREHMRGEIRDLQRRLGITTLYVTHDQIEALAVSDRIAVMHEGRIVQESTPRELYLRPVARFVADFVGATNFIEAPVARMADHSNAMLAASIGELIAATPAGVASGDVVLVSIRPENVRLHRSAPGRPNVFAGTVADVTFLGDSLDCRVRVNGRLLHAREHPTTSFAREDAVFVELPIEHCAVITDTRGVANAASLATKGASN